MKIKSRVLVPSQMAKGEGIIILQSVKSKDKIITYSDYSFNRVNSEGVIKELIKIINSLKEDMGKLEK